MCGRASLRSLPAPSLPTIPPRPLPPCQNIYTPVKRVHICPALPPRPFTKLPGRDVFRNQVRMRGGEGFFLHSPRTQACLKFVKHLAFVIEKVIVLIFFLFKFIPLVFYLFYLILKISLDPSSNRTGWCRKLRSKLRTRSYFWIWITVCKQKNIYLLRWYKIHCSYVMQIRNTFLKKNSVPDPK